LDIVPGTSVDWTLGTTTIGYMHTTSISARERNKHTILTSVDFSTAVNK